MGFAFSGGMFVHQSGLGLAAAALYALVAASCFFSAYTASARKQSPRIALHWLLIGGFFICLIVSRAFDLEDAFRQSMRASLRADDLYDDRRDTQRPLAAAAVVVFSAATFWAVYRIAQRGRGRRNLALGLSSLAALAMAALVALRLTSLHDVDRLLFGALKLNWFGDMGASLIVLGSAIYYARLITTPAR